MLKWNLLLKFKIVLNYLLLFLVSSIIVFFLYLRWIKHYFIISLTQDNGLHFIFMFTSCFIIFLIYSLQILVKLHKNNVIEQPLSNKHLFSIISIVVRLLQKVNIFYHAYNKIFTIFGSANAYTIYVLRCVVLVLKLKKNTIIIRIIIFVIIPRLIIIIFFLYELISGYFQYYYYYSLLLLFPLLFRILIFVLEDISPRLLPEVLGMINIHHLKDETRLVLKPEYAYVDYTLFYYIFYRPLTAIPSFMLEIKPIYSTITLYTNWFYFLMHVLGLLYALYIIYY